MNDVNDVLLILLVGLRCDVCVWVGVAKAVVAEHGLNLFRILASHSSFINKKYLLERC